MFVIEEEEEEEEDFFEQLHFFPLEMLEGGKKYAVRRKVAERKEGAGARWAE